MSAAFPTERAAKRAHLLATVEGLRDVVAAGAEEGERLRTLPPATVRALADSGLFALKVPESLGGAEADPVTQLEVLEALTHIDASEGVPSELLVKSCVPLLARCADGTVWRYRMSTPECFPASSRLHSRPWPRPRR